MLCHYRVYEAFKNKVYGNTLNNDNFFDEGKVHHQDKFFKIDSNNNTKEFKPINIKNTYYVKMVKGNEFFLLPQRFIKDFPVIPRQTMDIHLKQSDSQVWKLIQQVDSLNIPIKRVTDYRTYIDDFNSIEHECPDTALFLKFVSHAKGCKLALCGPTGSGKNSNLTILRQTRLKIAPKVKTPSKPKLYRLLYFNDYINIDEITSWKNSEVVMIEDLAAEIADEAPDFDKFSLDKNRTMETISNVNDKSFTFTFNPPTVKNPFTFAEKFKNFDKIEDRFPIFYVKGKVLSSVPRPTEVKAIEIMEKHFKDICDQVSTEAYFRANIDKEMHGYDRSKSKLVRRYTNNISPVLDVIDMYCNNQEEFDKWLVFMNDSFDKFKEVNDEQQDWTKTFNVETEEVK